MGGAHPPGSAGGIEGGAGFGVQDNRETPADRHRSSADEESLMRPAHRWLVAILTFAAPARADGVAPPSAQDSGGY